jgi:hypothetical protein
MYLRQTITDSDDFINLLDTSNFYILHRAYEVTRVLGKFLTDVHMYFVAMYMI